MIIQVSLISREGRRPLSTLIEVENWDAFMANKDAYQEKAIVTILGKRHMTIRDARKYGYTIIKSKIYRKEET